MTSEEEAAVAVEPPADLVVPRRAERSVVGHIRWFVGGAIGGVVVWLARRAYIAVPVATLSVTPFVIDPDPEPTAVDVADVTSSSEAAVAARRRAARAPTATTVDEPYSVAEQPASPPPVAVAAAVVAAPAAIATPPRRVKAQPAAQQLAPPPTTRELSNLYTAVGQELAAASKHDPKATELWPRYRWIDFMDALQAPDKRAEAAALLHKLRADIKAL